MRVATVRGIPIRLHWSLLALLGVMSVGALLQGGVAHMAQAVTVSVALLASVVLHELGHAIAGQGFGIPTAHITLYPFGGIAAMTEMPKSPRQELIIAAAGPAVNGALFLAFGLGAWLTGNWLFSAIAGVNLVMGVFNLVPAFPMDGGRILRSLLAQRIGLFKASQVAITVGKAFAWLFLLGGIAWGNWSLAFVGGFMIFATNEEAKKLRHLIHNQAWQRRWGGGSSTWWRDWEPQSGHP